jgi:hypothetical protein
MPLRRRGVTVVADRESDMYPAWASVPQPGFHLLSRAMHALAKHAPAEAGGAGWTGGWCRRPVRRALNRSLPSLARCSAPLRISRQREHAGLVLGLDPRIKLPARQPDRAARTATVQMRYGEVEICRPRDERDRSLPKAVRLRLIDVREVDPPEGVEPLHWRLLTTHDVADAEKAWQIVGWYQARWVIEQLFRVTKSQGLQLEDSQLASADRLVKLTAPRLRRGRLCDKSRLH